MDNEIQTKNRRKTCTIFCMFKIKAMMIKSERKINSPAKDSETDSISSLVSAQFFHLAGKRNTSRC